MRFSLVNFARKRALSAEMKAILGVESATFRELVADFVLTHKLESGKLNALPLRFTPNPKYHAVLGDKPKYLATMISTLQESYDGLKKVKATKSETTSTTGLMAPQILSSEFREAFYITETELPRPEITKKVWAFFKERDLVESKFMLLAKDSPLRAKLNWQEAPEKIAIFQLQKYVSPHIKRASPPASASATTTTTTETATGSSKF